MSEPTFEEISEQLAERAMKYNPKEFRDNLADLYHQLLSIGKSLDTIDNRKLIYSNEVLRDVVNFYRKQFNFAEINRVPHD